MRFMPHTAADVAAMLETIGVAGVEDLFDRVPAELRRTAGIKLPRGLAEAEVVAAMSEMAAPSREVVEFASFLGAGCYRHYVPAAVRAITARAEFATSYTPYQPEASQGTTQAIFEFQTLITQLTGLEVANASMYDGASAAAEAVLMARRLKPDRRVVAMSRGLWPDYRTTIRTYLAAQTQLELVEVPFDQTTGGTDLASLQQLADDRLLCTVTGYPNLFGVVEPLGEIAALTHRAGGLAIAVTAEALALGLLRPPGELSADIAVGEGQSFGIAPQFGGPGLGFMAARLAHVRLMPGRLVGETRDRHGRRVYCLTLATREQHIRRERATSNICTNHSLCALAATVYLTVTGRRGLQELAARNVNLAHQAAAVLTEAGFRLRFTGPFFNEFVVALSKPVEAIARAAKSKVLLGVALDRDYAELPDGLLISVTELNQPADFIKLRDCLLATRTDASAEQP
jgi:glycine dehydrogenase subunit 1